MNANAAWENVGSKITNIVPHPAASSFELHKTNATAAAAQAMQGLYYQYQYQMATYSLAPPATMSITGITAPYTFPLELPDEPKPIPAPAPKSRFTPQELRKCQYVCCQPDPELE